MTGVLSGLAPPDRGTVELAGTDVTGVPAEDLVARGLAMVPGGKAMFSDLTVLEALEVGARLAPRAERGPASNGSWTASRPLGGDAGPEGPDPM